MQEGFEGRRQKVILSKKYIHASLVHKVPGKAVIGKVNVDLNSNISANYGIRNIPTLLYFKNGQLVDKQVGVVPKSALAAKLDAQM